MKACLLCFQTCSFFSNPTYDEIIQPYLNVQKKKLRKWLSPLSQQISAISFRFAKIAHSKMSEMSASLNSSFPLFDFCWDCSSLLYSGLKIKHSFKHIRYNVVWYVNLAIFISYVLLSSLCRHISVWHFLNLGVNIEWNRMDMLSRLSEVQGVHLQTQV